MTWETFKPQIYELLEESKVVHPIKDKEKRKVVTMMKDLQQILANNEKQDIEDENCEDDLLQGKFKHFKGCLTTDGKDELGEDVWIKLTDSQKKKYYKKAQKLLKDVVEGFKEAIRYSDDYLYVDRHQDIVEMYNRDWLDWTDDYEIPTDIFSISIMLAQLVRYDGVIKETKDGIIPKVKVDLTETKKKKIQRYRLKDCRNE